MNGNMFTMLRIVVTSGDAGRKLAAKGTMGALTWLTDLKIKALSKTGEI